MTAPLLTVTAPADNSTGNKSFVTVNGTIDPTSTVELAVNQGTPQAAAVTGSSFTQTVNLASGLNTIEITATDLANKKNTLKRSIVSNSQHPTIAITAPDQDILTAQGGLTISGTIADAHEPVTVSVTSGTDTFTPSVSDGAFEQALIFSEIKTYPIIITVTETTATETTVQRNIIYQPLPQITIQTSPAGLSFTVDGTAYNAAKTFNWVPGSSHAIAVAATQTLSGTHYTFANWSDSGVLAHGITSPDTSATYTATYSYPATMISPTSTSTLAGASQTFTWTNSGATNYQLWAGSSPGGFNVGATVPITATTATISGLPPDGSTVYVRLWSLINGTWVFNDYVYTAASAATMITPVNGATLPGASQAFTWTSAGADLYQVYVGSTPGAFNLGASAPIAATTATIVGLPADGSTIYVRLWSKFGVTWVHKDYSYTAASAATMITPVNATSLAGASQDFTWTNAGADLYLVYVGSSQGTANLGASAQTTATTATMTGLPVDGSTVYVRLWSKFGTTWYPRDYTYTAAGAPNPTTMVTPVNGSTLAGTGKTFTWNNTGATQYQLWVGSSAGGFNIGATAPTAATTATITGLPADGSTIYVRLWSKFAGTWFFNDYTYTSGP
jgi:uncharacterized cupredoxin-like copper-binding protein